MKRTFAAIIAIATALAVGPSSAQAQWGIKGGIARSTLKVSTGSTAGTGITAGIVSNMGSGPVSLMSEALFVQRVGNTPVVLKAGGTGIVTNTNNMLDVTGLLRINLGTGQIKPILFAGGYYSYLISRTDKLVDSDGFTLDEQTLIADGSTTDYGWVVGGGIVLSKVTIDARYQVGLKHMVLTDSGADDFQTITIMIGVQF